MSLIVSMLVVFLADQGLKYAAFNCLENPTTVVAGFLRFVHVTNRGVAFGIGKDIRSAAWGKYLFVVLSLAIVVALLTLFARYCKSRLWARISIGLIVGGAISNLADRLMFGHVRDFIDFSFWWTFNGADLAICAGVVVLIAGMLREEKAGKPPMKPVPPLDTPSL
jgi:signal peptidase II